MTRRQIRRITGLLTDAITRLNATGGPTEFELKEAAALAASATHQILIAKPETNDGGQTE